MRHAESLTFSRVHLVTVAATLVALISGGGRAYGSSSGRTAPDAAAAEIASGSVSPTENPLVARYSIVTQQPRALVSVEFGTDTSYQFHTSAVSVPNDG